MTTLVEPRGIKLDPRKRGRTTLLFPKNGREESQPSISPLGATTELRGIDDLAEHRRKQFTPLCVFLFGRRGQGKTLLQTALAGWFRRQYDQAGYTGRNILSNYHISFADYSNPWILMEMQQFPAWAANSLLCVDEVASAYPGRRSMARINVEFANFLTQIRKRSIEVIFTTQFPQVVDRDILMQVDLFVQCEKVQGGKGVRMYVHDYWGQFTGKHFRKPWPPAWGEHDWEPTLWNTDVMFDEYRSNEVVAPIWSGAAESIIAQQWEGFGEQPEMDQQIADVAETLPTTLAELAWLRAADGPFMVLDHLHEARKLDPIMSTQARFSTWLKEQGYRIEQDGNGADWAEKPQ